MELDLVLTPTVSRYLYLFFLENHVRATLRQTQVLVIPTNDDLKDFQVFDQLVNAINEARRAARDYVTDYSFERYDEKIYGDDDDKHDDKEWV